MNKGIVIALALAAACTQAAAQKTIQILTPSTNTCRAFTAAMVASDKTALVGLAGWFIGYLSGVAQGTQTDFLHGEDVKRLSGRLYNGCLKKPELPLSAAAEELAKILIEEHRPH
jgi:hypothetical protein